MTAVDDRSHLLNAEKPWASELISRTTGAAWVTTFLTLDEAHEGATHDQGRHNAGQARLSSVTVHHYDTGAREWVPYESFPLDEQGDQR